MVPQIEVGMVPYRGLEVQDQAEVGIQVTVLSTANLTEVLLFEVVVWGMGMVASVPVIVFRFVVVPMVVALIGTVLLVGVCRDHEVEIETGIFDVLAKHW